VRQPARQLPIDFHVELKVIVWIVVKGAPMCPGDICLIVQHPECPHAVTTVDLYGRLWNQAGCAHARKLSDDLVSFHLKIVVIQIDIASAQVSQRVFSVERSAVWEIRATVGRAVAAVYRHLGVAKQLL
jgi:hypothetical protein